MRLFKQFWRDELGMILSAEAVVVGTVAVVGVTAGLSVVAGAVNDELRDVALAIRSLDQSYCVPAQTGCGAMTAGSSFEQTPVEKSLDELRKSYREAERQEESQAKRLRRQLKLQERQRRAAEDRVPQNDSSSEESPRDEAPVEDVHEGGEKDDAV